MTSHPDEIERIRTVYDGYRKNDSKKKLWSRDNPGNQYIVAERWNYIRKVLHGRYSDHSKYDAKVLDIGCGAGTILAEFRELGLKDDNLHGVDVIEMRVKQARQNYPTLNFELANAESLPYPAGIFDLVIFFTVFSSVLDVSVKRNIAREAARVLKEDGAVLWYDFRYNNPWNDNVRGIRKKEIQHLFRGFECQLKSITLLPQLARRLGRLTGVLYPVLASVPFMRTHYLGFFLKK